MNKQLFLSLALITLTAQQALDAAARPWVDPEDLEAEGRKEREARKAREEEYSRQTEKEREWAMLRAQQVKKVAEQAYKHGPILVFPEASLTPSPYWIGTADGIFTETIKYMEKKLGMQLSKIKKIKLFHNTGITNATLTFIAENFQALVSLDISECSYHCLTIEGLDAVVKNCPELTYINVTNCPQLHFNDSLSKFHEKYPRLHIIDNTPEGTAECF